jgi:AAA+ superfamily predicted ATPase
MLGEKFAKLDRDEPYPIETFPVSSEERATAVELLAGNRANVLLYGKEGSAKTQFAKALAAAVGKKLYSFHQESGTEGGEVDDIFILAFATRSLDGASSILLVDEAEDLLATGSSGGFFSMPAPPQIKARIHDVMDNAQCPIIWIVNHVDRMDASTRRRFAFAIEFHALSSLSIKNLARTWLEGIPLGDGLREKIVSLAGTYGLTAASLKYMRDTVSSVAASGMDDEAILDRVTRLFESNVRLLTGKEPSRPYIGNEYAIEALDTSVPPERLISLVKNAFDRMESAGSYRCGPRVGMRLLFHGPSGTGKTEFSRHVAVTLDRPLLVKRASDILGPYVGQSEQNVARMFGEAEASKSILLIDEADSFFFDRSSASHSWERTLVNEFLVRMEEFRGVLICSTNYAAVLDKALARRFHEIVEFKSLSKASVVTLLERYYSELEFSQADVESIVEAGPITAGDFGVLKGRTDFMEAVDITEDYVVDELSELAHSKRGLAKCAIGFGN